MNVTDAAETEVLIVGAGPTGLALGIDLARRGVDALVLEAAGELFPGSRGKGFQPRTMEVFDDLGVVDAIHAVGATYPIGMIWKDGERVGEHHMFEPAEPSEDSPYNRSWMVPQWRTQEVLAQRLAELGGRVAFHHEVVGVAQDAAGVTAHLSSGRTLRARYLVAADGGRSAVRRSLGIGMTGEDVDPNPTLVADVRISGLDRDNWHVFPPREGDDLLAVCPLAGIEDFQVMARFPAGSEVDTSPDGIRKVVAERSHIAAEDVTEVRWASDFRPRAALADRFRAGRVFIAGDAAHVHSPAGGQGLNTSIQDAYNLGWKLDAVLKAGARAALLDSYEEERRPIAADMLNLSTAVHRGEVQRGKATRQLGIGYRDSSLTVESRATVDEGAIRAGDRAPDGNVDGVRLFDAFRGPHWTLLALGVDAPGSGVGPAVPVVHGGAHGAYGTGLFLVRPDGYVGWAGDTPEGLDAYLGRFGLGA
ncbi:FAD-dependent oxidoreductase [Streptomyces sp. RS2]|uniref:FAD-dependent oxidoreductase n=1 Tax=Streptomyces sp. RS2 TaxID=1451205 RepID=UPI0021F82AB9|nr:FAD-dependent oxidoreductase [Streptomyces sp. RS2]MCW1096057.1 FAD-dependent oxidoreductase [Streptomyces sp. RS2]